MLGSANTDKGKVTLTSHTPIGEDGEITPEIPPIPASRNTGQRTDETPPPVPPKSQALLDGDLFNLNTKVPLPSLEDTKGETHVNVLEMPASSGNVPEESPYATPDPNKKTPKKNLNSDSRVDDQSLKESPYEEDIYEDPDNLDLGKKLKELNRKFDNSLGTSSTTLPPYVSTNGSEESLL